MKHPNIVMIIADDLGHWTLGCEGNKDAVTPNIDRLAKEGMQLRRFYCASPVCSPARASLLTGKMPSAHGVADWIRKGNVKTEDDTPVEYLKGQTGYTQYLKDAGYECALSGKWHLGDSQRPQQGFSHWYTHQRGGGPYFNAPMIRDGRLYNEPTYITHAITKDACEYIHNRKKKEKPFYLQVGYTAPHTPWVDSHPKNYVDLFRGKPFDSCPIEPRHEDQVPYDQFADPRQDMLEGYFAAVIAMDEGVGDILAALETQGILDDTLVIFTSDNGFNCGHHGIWGKGNGTIPFNMYESSVKVPFIVRAPGLVPEGSMSQNVVSAYDWFLTVLDLIGEESKEDNLPGTSFLAVLKGDKAQESQEAYLYDEYGDTRMLIHGDWKYIKRYPNGPNLLFNLREDPKEENSRFNSAEPSLIANLDRQLEHWFAEYSKPEMDSRSQGVLGFGQDKAVGAEGFEEASFCKNM